ncbi:shikimate kinase like 1 [Tasmannia lanceolata]|uniref:shikimate kinase like 1 n=1 Tax=Tasmannia lanceolata TaxID=3420 RepID=UPI0040649DA8
MEINVIHFHPTRNPNFSSSFFNFHGLRTFPISSSFSHKPYNFPSTKSTIPPPISPTFPTRISSRANQLPGARTSPVEHEPSFALKNKAIDISYELKGTSIFLVGVNGTMKTNLGKLLADVLRYYYFDSDGLVEQAAGGESAVRAFKENDEEGFRNSETEVLKQLSSMGRLVVCAGNGAVQSATNLAFLRYGISIWIDVPLDMLAKETMECRDQLPSTLAISTSDSFTEELAKLANLYEEMRGGYATADATVSLQKVASKLGYDSMEMVTTEEMAIEALNEIEKLTRVKKMMEAAARPF